MKYDKKINSKDFSKKLVIIFTKKLFLISISTVFIQNNSLTKLLLLMFFNTTEQSLAEILTGKSKTSIKLFANTDPKKFTVSMLLVFIQTNNALLFLHTNPKTLFSSDYLDMVIL